MSNIKLTGKFTEISTEDTLEALYTISDKCTEMIQDLNTESYPEQNDTKEYNLIADVMILADKAITRAERK